MLIHAFSVALAAILTLAGAVRAETAKPADAGQETQSKDATQGAAATGDPAAASQVLADLHHTHQMEIQMGEMAKKNGQSQAVQQFADRLIKDHKSASEKTQQVAEEAGITLPEKDQAAQAMGEKEHANMQKLQSLSGAQFDREFAKAMVSDHKKAIERLQSAQGELSGPVKDHVAQVLPVMKEHQKMAKNLVKQVQKAG